MRSLWSKANCFHVPFSLQTCVAFKEGETMAESIMEAMEAQEAGDESAVE